jgi:hypothetical protein
MVLQPHFHSGATLLYLHHGGKAGKQAMARKPCMSRDAIWDWMVILRHPGHHLLHRARRLLSCVQLTWI